MGKLGLILRDDKFHVKQIRNRRQQSQITGESNRTYDILSGQAINLLVSYMEQIPRKPDSVSACS